MGGSDAPAPPDYASAAAITGQSNLEAAIASGHINNPNIINPYGTQSVTWDGTNPTLTQNLSPEQREIYEKGALAKTKMLDAGLGLSDTLKTELGHGIDYSGLPGAPKNSGQRRNDVIDSMMTRINTDTAGQRDEANSTLIASGIRPGTAAYNNAMMLIDRQYNDARQQAIMAGGQESTRDFGMDTQSRQQAIAEMLTKRQTPLNEANALLTGAQVSNPFAGGLGYQAGANVQGANYSQAAVQQGQAQQNAYNQQQANINGNISAGAGLIGSIGSAAIKR